MEIAWIIVAIGAGLMLVGFGVRLIMKRLERRRRRRNSNAAGPDSRFRP
jgi:hypothetical protein